jgi:hypothetical protein
MSTSQWKKIPSSFPDPDVLVWIRIITQYVPFKAYLRTPSNNFEDESGRLLPWYMVAAWRPI